MKVTQFDCGPAANESELKAFNHIKTRLISEPGDDRWILLPNLAFSVNHQSQADEIDLVAIGPGGVQVIEIKHWTGQWLNADSQAMISAADLLTRKIKRIAGTLRDEVKNLPHVEGVILLTQEPSKLKQLSKREVRGLKIHTLSEWQEAIGLEKPKVLSTQQVETLACRLQPRVAVALDGSLRRLAGYTNLELQTPKEQRIHRVYKGSHPSRRDKVELHLYDLSASDDKNAETKAKREFDALHKLQLFQWAPRILDSFQGAPGYEGEMFFFTIVDPEAPSIEERTTDKTWSTENRVAFAKLTVHALAEFHSSGAIDDPFVHRNLSPGTILVKYDNSPIFTGFERTKIPFDITVASSNISTERYLETVAPEVQSQGFSAADPRSDIYALCACLSQLFQDRSDNLGRQASDVLARGLVEQPGQRATLSDIERQLSGLLGESMPQPTIPPARFWTEEQVISFHGHAYRIVSRLGSGGVGVAFKVVEIDQETEEELGTFVAKIAHESDAGQRVLRAYQRVRSHIKDSALSTIYEVASQWRENEFIALMQWVSGTPLAEYAGVLSLHAEDQEEVSEEALVIRWLRSILNGLDALHRNGLVHGDVSPRNLIVSESELVLTDYDCVVKIGERLASVGTVIYSSSSYAESRPAARSDDIYALAASFFHVLFEREPFRHGNELEKSRGLNWQGINREDYPTLAPFLDKATDPDPQRRFGSATEAREYLTVQHEVGAKAVGEGDDLPVLMEVVGHDEVLQLSEQRIDWLRSLLQSYPGSRWGNQETRGLDSDFAIQTYVETVLEETLLRDVRERNVRLIILCGNAGDGKTALLQHLSTHLGLGRKQSSERILSGKIESGPTIRMNLDGSASWGKRSADEILDEFLEPFQNGPPTQDIVHLLAINDGRLLEWIEGVEARRGDGPTVLTTELYDLLQHESAPDGSHIRFISLNQRSLVGGVTPDDKSIDTAFLGRLIDQLYGGAEAPAIWSPCQSCSAKDRCEIFRATRLFGPSMLPSSADDRVRKRARERLFEALQAVHLSGEAHITMRELRAALVYIMFGVDFCDDVHGDLSAKNLPYWDRAFLVDSPARQGEVLTELARSDPALEAQPQIDRYLASKSAPDLTTDAAPQYPNLSLDSARRRAFFEWTLDNIEQVTDQPDALGLARGRHLSRFRTIPLANEEELAELCELLCMGISRLENLPPKALERPGFVPLQITPRTPTETAFWVEKPLNAFRLEADLPHPTEGVERLHRQAFLVYRYRNGKGEERLRLGAELFHLLLELADGYQLGDISTDDAFANLSIFVQRLVREDERELFAWNPMQDETIYEVSALIHNTGAAPQQRLKINPVIEE